MYFQDYNEEVLRLWTIPNILLNLGVTGLVGKNPQSELNGSRFTSGDWKDLKFKNLFRKNSIEDKDPKFNLIVGCDVIYEVKHYETLIELFTQKLKIGGCAVISSKAYYFGNGGSIAEFEDFIKKSGKPLVFKELDTLVSGMGNRRSIFLVERIGNN